MSDKPNILDSLPSYGEGFKDYQRSAIPSSFASYNPVLEENEETSTSQTTKIPLHTNVLAFQPRGRERVERESPQKKRTRRKRAEDEVLGDIEAENGNQQQNSRPRRPTRRAAPKQFRNLGEEANSDDEDFM